MEGDIAQLSWEARLQTTSLLTLTQLTLSVTLVNIEIQRQQNRNLSSLTGVKELVFSGETKGWVPILQEQKNSLPFDFISLAPAANSPIFSTFYFGMRQLDKQYLKPLLFHLEPLVQTD